jgi:hypothetical protein
VKSMSLFLPVPLRNGRVGSGFSNSPRKNVQSLAASAGDHPSYNAASVVNNRLAQMQECPINDMGADGRTGDIGPADP